MQRSVCLLVLAGVAAGAIGVASGANRVTRSPLDGIWKWTWTSADIRRAHAAASEVGPYTATYSNGHVAGHNLRTGAITRARFVVKGNIVAFVFSSREPGVIPGRKYELKWSLYRDRLRFTELPGRSVLTLLTLKPSTRVR